MRVVTTVDQDRNLVGRIINDIANSEVLGMRIQHVELTRQELEAVPSTYLRKAIGGRHFFIYGRNEYPIVVR